MSKELEKSFQDTVNIFTTIIGLLMYLAVAVIVCVTIIQAWVYLLEVNVPLGMLFILSMVFGFVWMCKYLINKEI